MSDQLLKVLSILNLFLFSQILAKLGNMMTDFYQIWKLLVRVYDFVTSQEGFYDFT